MNVLNGDHKNIDFDEIEMNACSIEKTDGFEVIMNQIPDLRKKELILKIRNVRGIDLSVLDDFFEIYDKKPILREAQWYYQVKAFKSDYEKQYGYLNLPEK